MKTYKIKFLIILLSLILIVFTGCTREEMTKKPVIAEPDGALTKVGVLKE
ncbi:hypothetical protein [Clostridium sp.]